MYNVQPQRDQACMLQALEAVLVGGLPRSDDEALAWSSLVTSLDYWAYFVNINAAVDKHTGIENEGRSCIVPISPIEKNGPCSSKQANNFSSRPAAWGTQTAYDFPWLLRGFLWSRRRPPLSVILKHFSIVLRQLEQH